MKKITYNLASDRRVDKRRFAWRAGALAAVTMLLGGLAVANLARQRGIDRSIGERLHLEAERIEKMQAENRLLRAEIDACQKDWSGKLAATNRLIEKKSFSFIARLDFLEKIFHPGARILHVTLANEAGGRVAMTVIAQSLRDLFALYKKLAPYDLVIGNETQAGGEYQVNLSFRIDNAKI
jgi:hypothetical protein